MAKTDYKSVDEYHKAFPKEVRERMQTIRDIIHKVVPKVEEKISYQIPCFMYKGNLVYYAGFSNHITLSHPFSKELLEEFKTELKDYKMSKSAIQIPNDKELPLKLIKRIISYRKKENDADKEIVC